MIERFHRSMKGKLRALAVDKRLDFLRGDDWTQLIPTVVSAYNNTVNRMTSYSPQELLLGRAPKFPIDLVLNLHQNQMKCEGEIVDYVQQLAEYQLEICARANRVQDGYDARRKKFYDRGRREANYEFAIT